ncbi:MAG: glycosyl hydrolase [Planctomycetota bacterium]
MLLTAFGYASGAAGAEGPTLVGDEGMEDMPASWSLVEELSDEFKGDAINLDKWQIEPRANGWVWEGRAPGLFRPENVSVGDGSMNVVVGKLDEPVVRGDGREYLYEGAIVRSIEAGHPGWYYEARVKANATEMSTTFWLMTPNKPGLRKKLELDIQECVGQTSELTEKWGRDWDGIFHSNVIHRVNEYNPEKVQQQNMVYTETKNHERFYVYAAWWKSPEELRFYLDGKYVYSIVPSIEWDVPSYLQMAIETYDWNPVPDDGGKVASGTLEERTTRYDWIRVWKPNR